ncbi:MAG: rRNA (cytidine-2'-O-)-methyltransferase, partial [Chloroflexi bacterium]|nr:rRNA (cytidine-2'-O-)-methyltransferase [Chloroflexota bacterium]
MRNQKPGTLYIVATPIGNKNDISLRAIETLKKVDLVICEERRQGSTLLKRLNIQNELTTLNEHNESEMVQNILIELLNGKSMALISDCGTPVSSDPGRKLLQILYESAVPVRTVPG